MIAFASQYEPQLLLPIFELMQPNPKILQSSYLDFLQQKRDNLMDKYRKAENTGHFRVMVDLRNELAEVIEELEEYKCQTA